MQARDVGRSCFLPLKKLAAYSRTRRQTAERSSETAGTPSWNCCPILRQCYWKSIVMPIEAAPQIETAALAPIDRQSYAARLRQLLRAAKLPSLRIERVDLMAALP
jgi:hypothetical protein